MPARARGGWIGCGCRRPCATHGGAISPKPWAVSPSPAMVLSTRLDCGRATRSSARRGCVWSAICSGRLSAMLDRSGARRRCSPCRSTACSRGCAGSCRGARSTRRVHAGRSHRSATQPNSRHMTISQKLSSAGPSTATTRSTRPACGTCTRSGSTVGSECRPTCSDRSSRTRDRSARPRASAPPN